jgi:hypothetical protein
MLKQKIQTKTSVMVALIHELLKRDTFEHASDLKETIKSRCAGLRIPYDSGVIAEALDAVEHTRRTLPDPHPRPPSPPHTRPDGPAPYSHDEACRILAVLTKAVIR